MPPRTPAKPLVLSHGLPEIDHVGGHIESQYHPRIGAAICARIEAGETLQQVVADPAMPSRYTVARWRKMHPDFADMYGAMRVRTAVAKIERLDLARRSKVYWRIHKARVDGKRPRDWVSGRKSTFDRAWAQAWCDRLAMGEAAYRISAEPSMPGRAKIYSWLKRIPEFREMYVEARALQRVRLEFGIHDTVVMAGEGLPLPVAKRDVAYLEGRIGLLTPKVWRALPPVVEWAEPPRGGMRETRRRSD